MISGAEELADLFAILHDGVVVEASFADKDLVMRVKITYLAERIAKGFTTFLVRVHEVENLRFVTWPKGAAAAPEVLEEPAEIFVPPLDILSGETVDGGVAVDCNQSASQTRHCGGRLSFRAVAAEVIDQNGKSYSTNSTRFRSRTGRNGASATQPTSTRFARALTRAHPVR